MPTSYEKLSALLEEFEEHHVLFQVEDKNGYIQKILNSG